MAYPYVSGRVTEETLENSLIEEFAESCDHKLDVGNVIVTDSCLVEDKGYSKLTDMHSVEVCSLFLFPRYVRLVVLS